MQITPEKTQEKTRATAPQQPQENIIQSGEPSRSALRVATLRAAHQLLEEPVVFDDPVALPILGRKTEAEVREDPFQYNDPLSRGLRAALVARSCLAEEGLARSVAEGVTQYVVLGAGLDTFAYRNVHEGQGLQVFEVDHPSTQAWKKRALHDAGIKVPDSMRFAAVDFEHDTLADGLRAAGFRMDKPAYFSWLGVTVYLNRDAVIETLKCVAGLPRGSEIVFDYRVPASLLNPIELVIAEYLRGLITMEGEPWVSSFEPAAFQHELRALGFSTVDDCGPAELNARYFAKRKDGFRTGGGFRIMRAKI
jgi:methyltransferase (TIGR00027 family)